MIVFPLDRQGRFTLAGEVKDLYEQDEFELVLSQVTVAELLEVVARDFPEYQEIAQLFFKPFEEKLTRWPTPKEVQQVLPYVVDAEDAPIFAAVLLSQPDIVVSNDFETFHSERAKEFWKRHGIEVESLYGLLSVLGKRKRKSEGKDAASSD